MRIHIRKKCISKVKQYLARREKEKQKIKNKKIGAEEIF